MKLIIAVYGEVMSAGDTADALTEWKNWVLAKMSPPTRISGMFRSKPHRMSDAQGYRPDRYRSRFDNEIAMGNVVALNLTSMASNLGKYVAFDWDWDGAIDLRIRERGGSPMGLLGMDTAVCELYMRESIWAYQRLMSKFLRVSYGFIAELPDDFMPAGYAIGLAGGHPPQELITDANAWSRYARKECDHALRNVFGYNILNQKHLDIDVGGRRLCDWIAAERHRGRIEPLDGGLFLWTFQDGDDQEAFLQWDYPPVVRVREELKAHRAFPWQRMPGAE